MTNHEILQINPGATKEEIKKAFYKLAHQFHPDKGGDAKKFALINNAYQALMKGDGNLQEPMGYPPQGFSYTYTYNVHVETYVFDPTTGQYRKL